MSLGMGTKLLLHAPKTGVPSADLIAAPSLLLDYFMIIGDFSPVQTGLPIYCSDGLCVEQ